VAKNLKTQPKLQVTDGKFSLPKPSATNDNAISYLKRRGIDIHIIRECIKRKLIYQTLKFGEAHVVFVGNDESGKARYAMFRSCVSKKKGEAKRSIKRYSFRLLDDKKSRSIHLFESAIDALSYATLLKNTKQDWKSANLLSLGGISASLKASGKIELPPPVNDYLSHNPQTDTFYLHFDSDKSGMLAAHELSKTLSERYEVYCAPPPVGKDVNEYLLNQQSQQNKGTSYQQIECR
jgi:hypothetical protein